MELPQRRRNVSWFLCICIMCASSVYSKDTDTPMDAQDHSKPQGSDENKSNSYQIVQSDSEADKKEEAMRSDTGEPPGAATYTRQLESGNDQVTTEDDNNGVRDETQEIPETANTETMEVVPIPPVLDEEDTPASGTAIKEVREEEVLVEEKQQNISGGQQEENLPEVDDKVKTSEDVLTTLVGKEEVDAGSMDSHGDETQIEAPAYAEENISDGETAKDHQEAEEEVAMKDEDGLQVEEGNITSEDLKEVEKPEGTEPVLLEDEKKEQEEEEKKEEKEDGEGVGEGDGEEDKEEDDIIPEPIPSFDEWKEKMLQKALEEQEKLYGSRNDIPSLRHRQFVLKDSKNYASSDCGAKILSANDEAQKPNLVLNFNRDEYMINPCSANIWFIVELCEPIQIKLLEIANLELFSSVPESFRVYTSDRFPAREWRLLGTLYAREERNLQSFLIDEHLFTKFVKIELLTFFGKEHYCPLTVVRIFGTSMDEEIDSEEPETVLPPNPTPLAADLKENGILDHAKDAVISFVKNAAKAFTSEKKDQDCEGEDCERVVPDEVAPTPVTECWNGDLTTSMPDVEQAILDSGASVCFNPCDDLESEDFLRVCAAAVCHVQDYWRIFPNCCLLVLAQTTLHLCCSISNCYLTGSSTRDVSVGNAKGETPTGGVAEVPLLEVIPLETIPSTGHLIISNLERGRPVVFSSNLLLPSMSETESTVSSSPMPANTVPPAPVFSTPVSAAETISQAQLKDSAQEQHNVQRTIAPTPSFKGSKEVDVEISSPSTQLPSVVGTSSSMEGTDKNLPTSEATPTTIPASLSSSVGTPGQGSESPPGEAASSDFLHASVTSEEKEDEAEVPEKLEETAKKTDKVPKVDETPSSDGTAKQEGKVTDPGAKGDSAPTTTTETEVKVDENESKTDSATAKATESIQPQKATEPSHGNGGGAHVGISNYGAQKDSVFMRLNNRIKSLELNLSLSSKYLEELSKSYKKQMEEMQKSFNKTVTTLTEKVVKSQEKHTTNTADISRIDGQVEELTGIVSSISIKIEDILQEVIERHLFLMICEVLFFCSLFMICVRRERNQLRLARAMYEHHLDTPQRRNTMCASNPSQHSPRGSLRRGGTLRPSGSLDDLLIIGPTTPLREAMKANSGHQTKVKPRNKTVIQARTNGSLTDLTQPKQPMKTAKRKIDSYSAGNVANPAGIIFNGSSELKEESKSDSKILGRHSPETIGALNGSSNSKHKKVQNGSKVKR
ncbi:SUN domain-containing ossification factor-like isoform X2 [Apostichopus japonicus]|uniref:SUN domain-containing ossification factor-like isoform X2 n=1 Tax=Stichopus japonicus TaxID=307972 RepID=UPI003AB42F62